MHARHQLAPSRVHVADVPQIDPHTTAIRRSRLAPAGLELIHPRTRQAAFELHHDVVFGPLYGYSQHMKPLSVRRRAVRIALARNKSDVRAAGARNDRAAVKSTRREGSLGVSDEAE